MNRDEALKAAGAIPPDARADWDGTNHYEIATPAEPFWLDCRDIDFKAGASGTEAGRRLGAVLDAACAAPFLAAKAMKFAEQRDWARREIAYLREENKRIRERIGLELREAAGHLDSFAGVLVLLKAILDAHYPPDIAMLSDLDSPDAGPRLAALARELIARLEREHPDAQLLTEYIEALDSGYDALASGILDMLREGLAGPAAPAELSPEALAALAAGAELDDLVDGEPE